MRRPFRVIRAALLATTILGAPWLAHADPITLTALAATAAGAAASGAVGGVLGAVVGAALTAGIGFLGQQLFSPNETAEGQQNTRTRKFETHPAFRFSLGTAPLEGAVVFHHVVGETYYVAYLLNSVPSHPKCITKLVINDVITLDVPGLQEPEFADYNGVQVLQDIYDMQLGAGVQAPDPYGVSDAPDTKFWCGNGRHTQPPQQWLDEIGPNGTADPGVIKASDIWSGHTILFARYVDDNQKLAGERYSHGRPPPIKAFGRWSVLYDPRLDPTSGVTQLGQVAISMALTDPPASPADGDTYVVAATATGDWAGHEDEVAVWDEAGGAWQFTAPVDGQTIWNLADHARHKWFAATPAWELDIAGHDYDDVITWQWSQNASLANLILATHPFALGFDTELIPIQQVADAADDADAEFSGAASVADGSLTAQLSITNPGTETGDTSGWTTSGGFTVRSTNPAPHTGSFYFYGGPDTASSEAFQDVTVPGAAQGWVDEGTALVKIDWWQNAFGNEHDTGNIELTFFDGSSAEIGSDPGPGHISPNGWLQRSTGEVALPAGTRTIRIKMVAIRGNPSNNDAYFDDLEGQILAPEPWGVNGVVLIKQREISLLDPVLNTMAGHLDTTDGLLGWRAGVWKAPTDTLVQPSAGEISIKGARDAGFDSVRASLIWVGNDWEETDGPGYELRSGARVHPLELPLVAAHEQAAKLEKRFAERAEPLHTVEGTWDGVEADRRVGERVTFALFGLDRTSSTYAVTAKTPVIEDLEGGAVRMGVRMTLEEDLEASYAWAAEDYTAPDPATPSTRGKSNFGPPSSVVAAQENYASTDGGTASARLAITITLSEEVAGSAGNIEVEVTDSADGSTGWVQLGVLSVEAGQLTYVISKDPVLGGVTYTARAGTVRSLDGGESASALVPSNSVTIETPVRSYSSDYSGAYA